VKLTGRIGRVIPRFFAVPTHWESNVPPVLRWLTCAPARQACPFAAAVAAALASTAARADFRLCNNTAVRVSVSLAYTDGQKWLQEGWWNLKAGACETLLRGPLAAEFYYIYAMDERGGEWKGKTFMCTSNVEFKIAGRADCFARGYERTGFFEVDTGKDAKDWTVQLTDSSKPQAEQ
jgi:uncharacterized membrane protein